MKIKRLISLLIMTIFFISINIYANEKNKIETKQEIVFVLDRSGSMNGKEKNYMANELTKMFIDTLDSKSTNIGVIGFNDTIIYNSGLISLYSKENRNNLKQSIDDIGIKGSTDIGLAIKEAVLLLENSQNSKSDKIIVLLSDGETDLDTSKFRTYEESYEDEKLAIEKAINNDYKIYTVGIIVGDINYLNEISSKSSGKTYSIDEIVDVQKVFEQLSKDDINEKLIPIDNIVIDGVAENVSVKLHSDYIEENNFIIAYNIPLKSIEKSNGELYKSKYYSSAKLEDEENDSFDLKIKSNGTTNLKMYQSITSSLKPVMDTPQKISKDTYEIKVKVFDSSTSNVIEKSDYRNLKATLNINEDGQVQKVKLKESEDGFVGTIVNRNQENTEIYVTLEYMTVATNEIISDVFSLKNANSSPYLIGANQVKILLDSNIKEINLNKDFKDLEDDNLSFKITDNSSVNTGESVIEDVKIDNNQLIFLTSREGNVNIALEVTDDNGGSITTSLNIDVMPFWIYYKEKSILFGLISIIILLFIILLLRKKDKKQVIIEKETEGDLYIAKSKNFFRDGRLEGYFLCTKSGKEYPALFWNENLLANKSLITLGELLSFMDINENLMEARKIFFEATEKNTIIFWHRTKCTVYIGNREIDSGQQIDLHYDDKMYIIFENGETEIEVRYKKVNKKVLA